jgi:hypothetical protein
MVIRSQSIVEMHSARRRMNVAAPKIEYGLDFYVLLWDAGPMYEVVRRFGEK